MQHVPLALLAYGSIVWLASLFFAVEIAVSKRRSRSGAFWAGIVLGPLAVAYYGLMPAGGWDCERCFERIDPRASVCPCCQSENPTRATRRGAAQTQEIAVAR